MTTSNLVWKCCPLLAGPGPGAEAPGATDLSAVTVTAEKLCLPSVDCTWFILAAIGPGRAFRRDEGLEALLVNLVHA